MRQVESVYVPISILFILRWQLGSPCLPIRGGVLLLPSGGDSLGVSQTSQSKVFAGIPNLEVTNMPWAALR